MIGKLGVGGFARVFRCERTTDGKSFALKMMEPRNDIEKDQYCHEMGIMKMG